VRGAVTVVWYFDNRASLERGESAREEETRARFSFAPKTIAFKGGRVEGTASHEGLGGEEGDTAENQRSWNGRKYFCWWI